MPEQNNQSKLYFLVGILSGVAVISTVGFFIMLSMVYGGRADRSDKNTNQIAANTNINAQAQVPAEPAGDASKLSPVTDSDHIRGTATAPVTMILFSDFQCPYCARFKDVLDKVLTDYKGKVRLVFRHYPLSFHDQAEKAAEASECAGEQGKFWEMHDKIFAANTAGTMSVDQWKKDAKTLGLKTAQFNTCLDSGKYASKISAQEAEGVSAGVQGTPATFINGELVSGALPYESIKQVIDSKLQ